MATPRLTPKASPTTRSTPTRMLPKARPLVITSPPTSIPLAEPDDGSNCARAIYASQSSESLTMAIARRRSKGAADPRPVDGGIGYALGLEASHRGELAALETLNTALETFLV